MLLPVHVTQDRVEQSRPLRKSTREAVEFRLEDRQWNWIEPPRLRHVLQLEDVWAAMGTGGTGTGSGAVGTGALGVPA